MYRRELNERLADYREGIQIDKARQSRAVARRHDGSINQWTGLMGTEHLDWVSIEKPLSRDTFCRLLLSSHIHRHLVAEWWKTSPRLNEPHPVVTYKYP